VCVCVCVCVCGWVYMYACMHTCMHAYIHVCMHTTCPEMGELGVSHQMRYVLCLCHICCVCARAAQSTNRHTRHSNAALLASPLSLSLSLSLSLLRTAVSPVDPFLGKVKRRLFKLGAGRRWWLVDLSCGQLLLQLPHCSMRIAKGAFTSSPLSTPRSASMAQTYNQE
jgi:hypothetical protein